MKKPTILVTGSSRGIGRAVALLAAKNGYSVVVHGRSDSEALESIHREIPGSVKVCFDIADKESVHRELEKVGHIDVLVNNAGIGFSSNHTVYDIDDENALKEYKVNVLGTIHCIQALLPTMVEKGGGAIVNIASIRGHYSMGRMRTITYGATKAGIISMTKTLAKTYPTIRFNSVSPGFVETDMLSSGHESLSPQTIMGRVAKPEEIAQVVLFVASPQASYMTGSDILVDGGYGIQGI